MKPIGSLFVFTFESKMLFEDGGTSTIRCSAVCPMEDAQSSLGIPIEALAKTNSRMGNPELLAAMDALTSTCLSKAPASVHCGGLVSYGSFSSDPALRQTCCEVGAEWRFKGQGPWSEEASAEHRDALAQTCALMRDALGPCACRIFWDLSMERHEFALHARDACFALAEARAIENGLGRSEAASRRSLSI